MSDVLTANKPKTRDSDQTDETVDDTALIAENPVVDTAELTQQPVDTIDARIPLARTVPRWGEMPKPEGVRWLVRDMFMAGAPNSLVGDPGVGKSLLALDLAISVATGTDFLGRETMQGNVLFVNYDDTRNLPQEYAERLARGRGFAFDDLPLYYFKEDSAEEGLLDKSVLTGFKELVEFSQPLLVVVDSFSSAFPSLNGNVGKNIVRMYNRLKQALKPAPGATLVVIDHTARRGKGYSGSTQKSGQVRSMHIISKGNSKNQLVWTFEKVNGVETPEPFVVIREADDDTIYFTAGELLPGETSPKAAQAFEAALQLVQSAGTAGIARKALIDQVAAETKVGRRTIEGVVNEQVRPHPSVLEFDLAGAGNPKGYRWSEPPVSDPDGGEPVAAPAPVTSVQPLEAWGAHNLELLFYCPDCVAQHKEYSDTLGPLTTSFPDKARHLDKIINDTKGKSKLGNIYWDAGTHDYRYKPVSPPQCDKHGTRMAYRLSPNVSLTAALPKEEAEQALAAYAEHCRTYKTRNRVKSPKGASRQPADGATLFEEDALEA